MADMHTGGFANRSSATLSGDGNMPMHRHVDPRLVVILAGALHERDLFGQAPLHQFEFVVRPPFYLHSNAGRPGGATYVRLQLSRHTWKEIVGHHGWRAVFGRTRADHKTLLELSRDPTGGDQLIEELNGVNNESAKDPLSFFARQLRVENVQCRLAADQMGIRPYQLTRTFFQRYGVTPSAYRKEARLQRAIERLTLGESSLRNVAIDAGYADQSHMCRELIQATGRTPAKLRSALQ